MKPPITIPDDIFERWTDLQDAAGRLLVEIHRIYHAKGDMDIFALRRRDLSYHISAPRFYAARKQLISHGFLAKVRNQTTGKDCNRYIRVCK